ncbi:MAG: hypothetical protein ACYDH1_12305 [Anaerolineaceae bacterium]
MKLKLFLQFLLCCLVAISIFFISLTLGNISMGTLYGEYPDIKNLTLGLSIILTLLSFLFIQSFFQSTILHENDISSYTKVTSWIVVVILFGLALYIGNLSISIIKSKSSVTWEKFESVPQPYVDYNFVNLFQTKSMIGCENCGLVRTGVITIDGDRKPTLYMHPSSKVTYYVDVPEKSKLYFSIALAPAVWEIGKGDGVTFELAIDSNEKVENIYKMYIDPKNVDSHRKWFDYEIDLSPWVGQKINLVFITTPGPNGDDRFDWAGWGYPRIVQPVEYYFLDHFSEANMDSMNTSTGQAELKTMTIQNDTRNILYQHPSSSVSFSLSLPAQASLKFGLGMSEEVWSSETADGAEYNIYIRDLKNPSDLFRVFHKTVDPKNNLDDRRWFEESVELSRFGGKSVEITFEALPGSFGNYDFDWGGWSNPVLVDETSSISFGNKQIENLVEINH